MIHGNMLWNFTKNKYQLIDFEYAGFNIIGADIINICLESLYEYDTPEWPFYQRNSKVFGSDDHMNHLIKVYLAFFKLYLVLRSRKNGEEYTKTIPEKLVNILQLDLSKSESPFDDELTLLDNCQTKDFPEIFSKSKVFASINENQINFVKR
jgi:thiamine kinase-like enzyme